VKRRAFLLGMGVVACTKKATDPMTLVGSGATLPHPLYTRWTTEYARIAPNVQVNYQPLGSGAGQRQIAEGVVDFGASDQPLGDPLAGEDGALVHVPTTIGSVVLVCNVPDVAGIALDAALAADVFLGNVTRWDDERLRAQNPSATLPPLPIKVVYRAEGSGTSAALTSALAKSHAGFKEKIGVASMPQFPVGVGAKGSLGLVSVVESMPGAIGYVEIAYAKPTKLVVAKSDAISALSLIAAPREPRDRAKADALTRFLWWGVHEGQAFAKEEGYTALDASLVARAEKTLHALGGV